MRCAGEGGANPRVGGRDGARAEEGGGAHPQPGGGRDETDDAAGGGGPVGAAGGVRRAVRRALEAAGSLPNIRVRWWLGGDTWVAL
eukprot:37474-Pyramimonas_sp.AAC.1